MNNGGTITGRVVLDGDAPVVENFEIAGAIGCGAGKKNDRLRIGRGGGIEAAVVCLSDIKQGKNFPELRQMFHQQGCRYVPGLIVAPAGDSVGIVNDEDMPHNVRVENVLGDVLLNRTQPVRGKADEFVIPGQGIYSISCDYHPWMNATIFGVENPYVALTGPDGSFLMQNVPPGTHQMKVYVISPHATAMRDNTGKIIRYRFGDPWITDQSVTVRTGENVGTTIRVSPEGHRHHPR